MMEPQWLQERRQQAQDLFAKLPTPTTGEGWIRTNFSREKLDALAPATAQHPLDLPKNQGAIVLSLSEALKQYPEKVKQFLGKTTQKRDNKFIAQNEALWSDGIFLYIPQDTVVSDPISLTQEYNQEEATFFPRVLVVAERGSKATVVYHTTSHNQKKTNCVNAVSEVFVEDSAELTWVEMQTFGPQTIDVAWKHFSVADNATLKPVLLLQGGKKAKWDLDICLNGRGARAETIGLIQAAQTQHLELNSLTHHMVPETTANILVKTSVADEAKTIFQGMIRIEKAAQKTNSYMANHNLLLSDHCHADTIPRLEIEADDVKASHGATISHVDAEQMFYLKSRGLEDADACQMLVDGFYEDIFGRIPIAEVREFLRKNTQRKQEVA